MAQSDEFEIVEGTDVKRLLTFTSEDEVTEDNPEGRVDLSLDTVYWWMRNSEHCEGDTPAVFKSSGDSSQIELRTQSGDTLGQAYLKIVPEDTRGLRAGIWRQEAQVVRGDGSIKAALPPTNVYLIASGSPLAVGPPTPDPGDPAAQTEAERNWVFTLPSDGDSFAVTIPGSGMYDDTYTVQATVIDPNGGPIAAPIPINAGRTKTGFTLELEGTMVSGALIDIHVRDR